MQNFYGFDTIRCIRFNKIDGFIKTCDGIRYLVILNHSWSDKIWDSLKYLISEKKWYYR